MVHTPVNTRRLSGRIALITGASRGIGAAVARRYAMEGAQLVLAARSVTKLAEVTDAIRAEGGQAMPAPIDLSESEQIEALSTTIARRFGRLDILVGNAAMLGVQCPLAKTDLEQWRQVMDLNVTANFQLIRTFDPLLRASSAGRVIFVTSSVARRVIPKRGVYAVSKAALEMVAGLYAAEVAHTPLRVNLIDPGRVRTRMRVEVVPDEDPMLNPPPEAVTDIFVQLAQAQWQENGALVRAQSNEAQCRATRASVRDCTLIS